MDNPDKYEKELQKKAGPNTSVHYPSAINVWSETYPNLIKEESLVEQIIKKLYSKGLVYQDSMHKSSGRVTTNYGREFLEFISN